MKYLLLHGDGFADVPTGHLGGKTPLEAATTPHLDGLAEAGELGLATIQADGLVPNSDITELAILGYDPRKWYPGPAPFEAAGLGITLGAQDVVYRCNMVTLRAVDHKGGKPAEVKKLGPSILMEDETAGGLETEEARELIDALNEQLGSETIQFYPGSGHRHLMVWAGGKAKAHCTDPHDIVGRAIGGYLPTGDGSDILRKLMDASLIILSNHPINEQRREGGLKPAHCLWLWGQGRAPQLPSLTERCQIVASVLSASDIHRGIGLCAGLEAGGRDILARVSPDFRSLGEAALQELETKDFVYVHVQAPAEIMGDTDSKAKVKVMEEFDRHIMGTLLHGLSKLGPHRILFVCDRILAPDVRPGMASSVLFLFYEGPAHRRLPCRRFSEAEVQAVSSDVRDATKLIVRLLPRSDR